MKRILQVIGSLNNGGSQAMIMNIYRNIDREKYQFDFMIFREERFYEEEIKKLGGKVYYIQRFERGNYIGFYKKWDKFLKDHKEYKIIHGHVRSIALLYCLAAKNNGRLCIVHSHNTSSGKGIRAIIKNIFQFPIRYIADDLIACSNEAGKWLFGSKNNFTVINNPVECKKFKYSNQTRKELRTMLGIGNSTVLIHIGRFSIQKNHDFLIEIYRQYYQINPDSVLLLIGNGELIENIKNKVSQYELTDKVKFLGVRSDVQNLLCAADIMLFPSLYEGLPVALIEAQTNGLPVLTSDMVTKEVDITGLVNHQALSDGSSVWANKIRELLDLTKENDRSIYEKVMIAHGYDVKDSAIKLINHYDALLY